MANLKHQSLLITICAILAEATQASVACAGSIFVPGASSVRVDFESTLARAVGDVPGIDVGTPVIGRLVYDASSTSPFPVLDFFLSADDIDFTIDDVLSASVVEFLGTAGFSAGADLKGRPGLGDWSELVAFQIFREFGDSNLFLSAGDGSAHASGHVALSFEAASPIPEPSSLVLLVTALCVALWARMRRVVRN